MKKLLVAVSSDRLSAAICDYLKDDWDIVLSHDGKIASDYLKYYSPDALILDVELDDMSGFDVLSDQFRNLPSAIIAIGHSTSPSLEKNLSRWGVDYFFQIPFQMSRLAECLGGISTLQSFVSKRCAVHLRQLGFSANLVGYNYLLLAINALKEDASQSLHKEVYVIIGKMYGMKGSAVERAIRSSIDTAWKHRIPGGWERYFPVNARNEVECPSNKAFLMTLVNYI